MAVFSFLIDGRAGEGGRGQGQEACVLANGNCSFTRHLERLRCRAAAHGRRHGGRDQVVHCLLVGHPGRAGHVVPECVLPPKA